MPASSSSPPFSLSFLFGQIEHKWWSRVLNVTHGMLLGRSYKTTIGHFCRVGPFQVLVARTHRGCAIIRERPFKERELESPAGKPKAPAWCDIATLEWLSITCFVSFAQRVSIERLSDNGLRNPLNPVLSQDLLSQSIARELLIILGQMSELLKSWWDHDTTYSLWVSGQKAYNGVIKQHGKRSYEMTYPSIKNTARGKGSCLWV